MTVTGSKTCIDCKKEYKPTSNVQKRCPDCAKARKISKTQGAQGGKVTARTKRKKSTAHNHDGECEGCKALQMQLDDLSRAEKIMVAAGLVAPEKFEQARKIVRELAK